MAHKTVEGRSAGRRSRPSECLSRQIDSSEVALTPFAVHRLARRLGISIEVTAVVAQLAGLGPREARP